MRTSLRFRLAVPLAAALFAVPAARAQDTPPDTIRVDRGAVVIIDRDGNRIFESGDFDFRVHMPDAPFSPLQLRQLEDEARRATQVGQRLRSVWAPQIASFGFSTPELMEQEAETQRLARRVREAEGAERERLEAELRTALDDLFEAKMALRAERIDELEAELTERREQYEARRAEQDAIVERRLRDLLGEDDVLDW